MTRLRFTVLLLFVVFYIARADEDGGIGDRLWRSFRTPQPLTQKVAEETGWTKMSDECVPGKGIVYSNSTQGITRPKPSFLLYTASGQISGFGVRIWGHQSPDLVSAHVVELVREGIFDIYVITRDPETICTDTEFEEVLGDRLLVGGTLEVPYEQHGAVEEGWVAGNCLPRLGVHYSYDIASPGDQTWNVSTHVPVMSMYDPVTGLLTGLLIDHHEIQVPRPLGVFEGPYTNQVWCLNWCDNSSCDWSDNKGQWAAVHFSLSDPTSITCEGAACLFERKRPSPAPAKKKADKNGTNRKNSNNGNSNKKNGNGNKKNGNSNKKNGNNNNRKNSKNSKLNSESDDN